MKTHLADLIKRASGKRVLCVGDVMLDRFVYGTVDRISPESPVPVLRQTGIVEMPGGAGNVARNMAAMGLEVTIVGYIGQDDAGANLERALGAHPRIETRFTASPSLHTIVKTRFVASNQQLLRVDAEDASPSMAKEIASLRRDIEAFAPECAAIVISDYAKGAIRRETIETCVEVAR